MKRTTGARVLAQRYAGALLDVVVDQNVPLERVAKELHEVAELLEKHAELSDVLSAPTIAAAKRVAILQQILGPHDLTSCTLNTLALLTAKDRIMILPDVSRQFQRLLMEHAGVESGEVVSAHPLTSEQQRRLAESLGAALGKTMELSYRDDVELVGGLVVRIGNRVYDASVATALRRFKEKALAGL